MSFPFKAFQSTFLSTVHKQATATVFLNAGGRETLNTCSVQYPSYQKLVQTKQMGSFLLSPIPMNIFKRQSECKHYEQGKKPTALI